MLQLPVWCSWEVPAGQDYGFADLIIHGGPVMETAFLPVFKKSEAMTPEHEVANTRAAHLVCAEAGITTAQEGAAHLAARQAIDRAADAGANLIDVVAFPFIADLDKILAEFPRDTWLSDSNGMKIGGVKISIDGSPQGKTAVFTTPYMVPGPNGSLSGGVMSGHVQMDAPNPREGSSSVSHFNTTLTPNEVMEPSYVQSNLNLTRTVLLMKDIG